MFNKWIKKLRACSSKNKSFPLLSKSRKCKTKRTDSKIKVFSDKNNKVLTDNSRGSNLKKIIKFLSPKTDRKKKNEEKARKSIYSKNSQDSGWVEMTRSSSRSSLIITHGNFSTSSPVFNKKQFDNFCYDLGMDCEVEAIPKINSIDIEPINKNDLTCSTIESEETGINLDFDENSTIVNGEVDLIRANSDSEILPLTDEEEFTTNYNILSQSFPTTCNSTRRESSNKLFKCIVGIMFAHEFTEKPAEESSIFIDQDLFASFDQSLEFDAEDQSPPMRDTLMEISTRRQSFSDNNSSLRINCNNRISFNDFNCDNVIISLPEAENYECNKRFDLLKISESVEVF